MFTMHHLFSLRVINDWNELPEDIINADSTDLFKTYLLLRLPI